MCKDILANAPVGFTLPHHMTDLPPTTPILVGFSGGADSVLLLYLLVAYGKTHGAPIYAAHFHHGIRGDEADRDRDFCRDIAKKWDIPLLEGYADIPAMAEASGHSLETEARIARYAFFEKCMREHRIPLLATAHHANDQLETLLLRFLRGSGTRGMGGIHPVRAFANGFVIRPLLSCTKEDVLHRCEQYGLSYVTDSTNMEDDATRNRVRHHLIPLMASLTDHGDPTAAALRLSAHAREDEDFIDACVQNTMASYVKKNQIALDALRCLHPALGKRILNEMFMMAQRQACIRQDGKYSLSSLHLDSLWAFCGSATSGQRMHLPGQMQVVIQRNTLYFLPQTNTSAPSDNTPIPLPLGITAWDGAQMGIGVFMGNIPPLPACHIIAQATFPVSILPLSVRRREAGDVMMNHGMHKKLKKLLCDKGVPLELRDRLPLICYGETSAPLWYPTVAFADGFMPPKEGETCVNIIIFEQTPLKGTNL